MLPGVKMGGGLSWTATPTDELPNLKKFGLRDKGYEKARQKVLKMVRERRELASRIDSLKQQYAALGAEFRAKASAAYEASVENGDASGADAFRKPLQQMYKEAQKLEKQIQDAGFELEALDTALIRADGQAHQALKAQREDYARELASSLPESSQRALTALTDALKNVEYLSDGYNALLLLSGDAKDEPMTDGSHRWGLSRVNRSSEAQQKLYEATHLLQLLKEHIEAALEAREAGVPLDAAPISTTGEPTTSSKDWRTMPSGSIITDNEDVELVTLEPEEKE